MGNSRKIIGKNRNLRKRSRKGGMRPNVMKENKNADLNLLDSDGLSYSRFLPPPSIPPKKEKEANTLIYVCCLIDSEVAMKITQARENSIIYLNCNPYNTFSSGWRLNGWGNEGYFGGMELYKLFGPEGTGIIDLRLEPKPTFEFCKQIIELLNEKNIIVIDTADFNIKPILVDYGSETGGEWYKNHLNLSYEETKEDLGYKKFTNAKTEFSTLDKKIIDEFELLAKHYKSKFIDFENKKFKRLPFNERYQNHKRVLREAVNLKLTDDNIKKCFNSVLDGNWAINKSVRDLQDKSTIEILEENKISHAASIMTMWQKWVSGVYYGPKSPPLLHDFIGLLFACLHGTNDEIIDENKLSVEKLQNKILMHAKEKSENIMKILNDIKTVYPKLEKCKLFVDGESDDLLTIIAACKALDNIIQLDIVFQKSVFDKSKFPDENIIPTTAINYKKKFGVDLANLIDGTKPNSILAIERMMEKYDAYVSNLFEYLKNIRNTINFEIIECTGLLPKIQRYKDYKQPVAHAMKEAADKEAQAAEKEAQAAEKEAQAAEEEAQAAEAKEKAAKAKQKAVKAKEKAVKVIEDWRRSDLITFFVDTDEKDISIKAFSNVMGNVQKVMLAIKDLGLSGNINVHTTATGGRSKKRRRPTKRRRHTKRRRAGKSSRAR